MKIDKRNKIVELDSRDDTTFITLVGDDGETITLKLMFTKKGFGLQIFGEEEEGPEEGPFLVFREGDTVGREMDYFGAWKLY